jgi:predicted CoA-binding protein
MRRPLQLPLWRALPNILVEAAVFSLTAAPPDVASVRLFRPAAWVPEAAVFVAVAMAVTALLDSRIWARSGASQVAQSKKAK